MRPLYKIVPPKNAKYWKFGSLVSKSFETNGISVSFRDLVADPRNSVIDFDESDPVA